MSKQQEVGVQFEVTKIAKNLLFDYSFQVRKTLAINLPRIKVDFKYFLDELLRDEDEVVVVTCQTIAEYIVKQ